MAMWSPWRGCHSHLKVCDLCSQARKVDINYSPGGKG